MPEGPQGQKRKADVIGNAARATDRLWANGEIHPRSNVPVPEWEANNEP